MIENIGHFSGKLRENGSPASIRSTELACKAIDLIDDNDEKLKEA